MKKMTKALLGLVLLVASAGNAWAQQNPTSPGATPQWIEYNGNIENVDPGEYTIQFREVDGSCTSDQAEVNVTLTERPVATISSNAPENTVCAGSTVVLTANEADSYLWSTGETTRSITVHPTASTTYTVTIVKQGCSSNLTEITITVNPTKEVSVELSASVATICEGTLVTFTAIPTNGGESPTYRWFKNNIEIANETSATYATSQLTNGDAITVELTSDYLISSMECLSQSIVESTPLIIPVVPTLAIITTDQQNVVNYGESSGSITIRNMTGGGVGDKQINFNNDPARQYTFTGTPIVVDGLASGDYFIEATDQNGCSSEKTIFTITQPSCSLKLVVADHEPYCLPEVADLTQLVTVSGFQSENALITYYSDDTYTSPLTNPEAISESGTYYIKAALLNGCTDFGQVKIVVGNRPSLVVHDPVIICNGATANISSEAILQGSTLYDATMEYIDNTPDKLVLADATSVPGGNYLVIATASNGCSASAEINVVENPPVSFQIDEVTPVNCYGDNSGSVKLSGITGGTGIYQVGIESATDSHLYSVTTASFLSPNLKAGDYKLYIIDDMGCSSDVIDVKIKQPAQLEAEAVVAKDPSCFGAADGELELVSITGGQEPYLYNFNSAGFAEFNSTPVVIGDLKTDSYEIIVKDALGCTIKKQLFVDQPQPVEITTTVVKHLSCKNQNDGKLLVQISGGLGEGYTYYQKYVAGTTYNYDVQTENYLEGLKAGDYIIEAKDGNGCQSSNMTQVTINGGNTIYAEVGDILFNTCRGESQGQATLLSVNDELSRDLFYQFDDQGWQPYTRGSQVVFEHLASGKHHVYIRDGEGCEMTPIKFDVGYNYAVDFKLNSIVDATCNASVNNGHFAIVDVVGGDATKYSYSIDDGVSWTDFSNSVYVADLVPYIYSVVVKDAQGCSSGAKTAIISRSENLALTHLPPTPVTCYGLNNGKVSMTSISGTGGMDYMYSLNPASVGDISHVDWTLVKSDNVIGGLRNGTYPIFFTDTKGCGKGYIYVNITQPDLLEVNDIKAEANCIDSSRIEKISIGNIKGGNGSYSLSFDRLTWSSVPSSVVIDTFTIARNVEYWVRDQKGCTTSKIETEVNVTPFLKFYHEAIPPRCESSQGSDLIYRVDGGSGNGLQYTLDDGAETNFTCPVKISDISSGLHTLNIKDDASCVSKVQSFDMKLVSATFIDMDVKIPTLCSGELGKVVVNSINGETPLGTEYSIDNINWHPLVFPQEISGLGTGTHYIYIKEEECTYVSAAVVVPKFYEEITMNVDIVQPECVGQMGVATLSEISRPEGGNLYYSLDRASWTSIADNSSILSDVNMGTHSLFIKDVFSDDGKSIDCISREFELSVNKLDSIEFYIDINSLDCTSDTTNVFISNLKEGVEPDYFYSLNMGKTVSNDWLPLSEDMKLSFVESGEYTIGVKNGACQVDDHFTIAKKEKISFEQSVVNPDCYGETGSLILSKLKGGCGYGYAISIDGDSFEEFSVDGQSVTVEPVVIDLAGGTHEYVIRDAKGCTSAPNKITVIVPKEPVELVLDEVFPVPTGSMGSVVVDRLSGGSGSAYYYTMDPSDVSSNWDLISDGTVLDSLTIGTKAIQVKDEKECLSAIYNFDIVEGDPLSAIIAHFKPSCSGNERYVYFQQIGNLSNSYQYKLGNDQETAIDLSVALNANNLFNVPSLIFTNGENTVNVKVTEVPLFKNLIYNQDFNSEQACFILVNGGAKVGYKYQLDQDSWLKIDPAKTVFTSNGLPANYLIKITDTLAVSEAIISDNLNFNGSSQPVVEYTLQDTRFVGDKGVVTLTNIYGGSGTDYRYQIDNSNYVLCNIGQQINLEPGTHRLTIKDSEGCTSRTRYIMVSKSDDFSVNLNYNSAILCHGDPNVSIQATARGFNPATDQIHYSWYKQESGVWVEINGQIAADLDNISAGSYRVIAINSANIAVSDSVVISDKPALLLSVTEKKDISCFHGTNGAISLDANGGTLPYLYRIVDSLDYTSNEQYENLIADSYQVQVKDANGCLATSTVVLTEPEFPLEQHVEVVSPVVNGGANGWIKVTVQGGSGSHLNRLSDSNGTKFTASSITVYDNTTIYSYSHLPVGEYLIESYDYDYTMKDSEGCFVSEQFLLGKATPVVIAVKEKYMPQCYGDRTGRIELIVSGGSPFDNNGQPYRIDWQFIDNDNNATPLTNSSTSATNLPGGLYRIKAVDKYGESASVLVNLIQPNALKFSSFISNNVTCLGNDDGLAEAVIEGGVQPYTFKLNDDVAISGSFTNLKPDNYLITVVDRNGCKIDQSFAISQPEAPLTVDVESVGSMSQTNPDGQLIVKMNGGWLPYLIQLLKKEESGSVLVQQVESSDSQYSFENLSDGEYSVVLSDNNLATTVLDRCSVTKDTVVNLYVEPQLRLTLTSELACYNDKNASLMVEVLGSTETAFVYKWYKINNRRRTRITGSNSTLSNLTAGDYEVDVTTRSGFSKTAAISIIMPEKLVVANSYIQYVGCYQGDGGRVETTASGGTEPYSFVWSNGQTGNILENAVAGTYKLNVTDDHGCSVLLTSVIQQPRKSIDLTLARYKLPKDDSSNDGSITMNVTEGWSSYSNDMELIWLNEAGETIAYNTTTLRNVGKGTYTLLAKERYNYRGIVSDVCQAEESFELFNVKDYPLDLTTAGLFGCSGDKNLKISAKVLGQNVNRKIFKYNWFTIEGLDTTLLSDNQTIENIGAGTYRIHVIETPARVRKNQVLVEIDSVFTINNPEELDVLVDQSEPKCFDGADGTLDITPQGGLAPYTTLWQDGNNSFKREGLQVGSYSLELADANGCRKEFDVDLTSDLEPVTVDLINSVPPTTYTSMDGLFDVTVHGGVAPYRYVWTDKNNLEVGDSQNLETAGYGVYQLEVIDSNNCSYKKTVKYDNLPLYVGVLVTDALLCPEHANGVITLIADGGTPFDANDPYQVQWFKNFDGQWNVIAENVNELNNLSVGYYKVEVTDFDTTVSDSIVLESQSKLKLELFTTDADCKGTLGTIEAKVTGAIDDVSYLCVPGNFDTPVLTELMGSTYNMTVTDGLGCIVSESAEIKQSGELFISQVVTDPDCSDPANGEISLIVEGGSGEYIYDWVGSESETNSATQLGAGTYQVNVQDRLYGCYYSGVFELHEPTQPESLLGVPDGFAMCNGQKDQLVSPQIVPGNTYLWTSEEVLLTNTPELTISHPGSYKLDMVENGCHWEKMVEVVPVDLDIDAMFLASSYIYCNESLVLINTSLKQADQVQWKLPENASGIKTLNSTDFSCELSFSEPGEYDVILFVTRGGCYEEFVKKIIVFGGVRDGELVPEYTQPSISSLVVSPTTPRERVFNVNIYLTKNVALILKMYNSTTGQVIPLVSFKANLMNSLEKSPEGMDQVKFQYSEDYTIDNIQLGTYIIAVFGPMNETMTGRLIVN